MQQAIMTSSLTILGGIIVFIVCQYILKFHFEPMSDLRKIIGQISKELILYANKYSNPIPDSKLTDDHPYLEVSQQLRDTASQLIGAVQVIPCYRFWSFLGLIPSLESVDEARSCLIAISNSMWGPNPTLYASYNLEASETIIKKLRIKSSARLR